MSFWNLGQKWAIWVPTYFGPLSLGPLSMGQHFNVFNVHTVQCFLYTLVYKIYFRKCGSQKILLSLQNLA